MKRLLVLVLFAFSSVAQASPEDEINHLKHFVRSTTCQYDRNGTLHNGEQAVEHIQKKADYYADDIKTAEDFIKYSATKSMISGRKYQVRCEGQPTINSRDWLLNELKAYRSAHQ